MDYSSFLWKKVGFKFKAINGLIPKLRFEFEVVFSQNLRRFAGDRQATDKKSLVARVDYCSALDDVLGTADTTKVQASCMTRSVRQEATSVDHIVDPCIPTETERFNTKMIVTSSADLSNFGI